MAGVGNDSEGLKLSSSLLFSPTVPTLHTQLSKTLFLFSRRSPQTLTLSQELQVCGMKVQQPLQITVPSLPSWRGKALLP